MKEATRLTIQHKAITLTDTLQALTNAFLSDPNTANEEQLADHLSQYHTFIALNGDNLDEKIILQALTAMAELAQSEATPPKMLYRIAKITNFAWELQGHPPGEAVTNAALDIYEAALARGNSETRWWSASYAGRTGTARAQAILALYENDKNEPVREMASGWKRVLDIHLDGGSQTAAGAPEPVHG